MPLAMRSLARPVKIEAIKKTDNRGRQHHAQKWRNQQREHDGRSAQFDHRRHNGPGHTAGNRTKTQCRAFEDGTGGADLFLVMTSLLPSTVLEMMALPATE
jgi:hypothetical protein